MSRIILWSLVVCAVALACRDSTTKDSSAFLPGIYINQSENEFSRVVDTFIIRRVTMGGDSYLVTRRSSFQRVREGTKLPAEFQVEQWTAVYEAPVKILRATDKGKELRYEPTENRVYNGNSGYEKIE